MQVDFYQLGGVPIERVLPRIAERVLGGGGRLLVVCGEERLSERIDVALWGYAPDAFLPHGRAGRGGETRQPVLIAAAVDAANGARNVALIDGVWRDEALAFDRVFHFFDAGSVAAARIAWRGLAGRAGVERRFWRQDAGAKWSQVA